MPSNHTEHYNLSQWEKSDAVLMDDFNADNAKLDEALGALAEQMSGKADASAVDSLSQTVSSQGGSLNSHAWSISRLGNCQVYTTSYTGTGSKARSYSFPGYPVFVHIREGTGSTGYNFFRGLNDSTAVTYSAEWSGRTLSLRTPDSDNFGINVNGFSFYVFALLDMSK